MREIKESIECAGINAPLRWIKFEHYTRYHAIYARPLGSVLDLLWARDTAPGSPR
jgi:hypothetical protein